MPKKNYNGRPLSPFVFQGDARGGSGFLSGLRGLLKKSQLLQVLQIAGGEWKRSGGDGSLAAPDSDGIRTYLAYYTALINQILPNSSLVVFDHVHHWPMDEDRDAYLDMLENYLNTVESEASL